MGQPVAVETLRNALRAKRLSGAYLFIGPRGVGKSLTARELAKALNCEKGEEGCDTCLSCRKMDGGNHPDLLWVYPAEKSSQIPIEAIRELKHQMTLRPWEGKRRIAVIPEIECATDEAQNAFLKILEETPGSGLFILTSVQAEGILPTVLSRCKVIRFGPIPRTLIQETLQKRSVSSSEAALFSKLCHGNLEKALTLKETFFKSRERMDQLLERALQVDEEKEFFEDKETLFETLEWLITWYRDLWLVKEGTSPSLLFHEDRLELLEEESSRWKSASLESALSELLFAREQLDQRVNTKLLFYVLSRKIRAFSQ